MWIEPLPNGKYKACDRYEDPLTGKLKKVSVTIDKDTKQARKMAQEAIRQRIAEKSIIKPKESITLSQLVDRYNEWQKKELKSSSMIQTTHHTEKIRDIIGKDAIVSRLNAGLVSDKFRACSAPDPEKNRMILYFKAMIRWAYAHDLVDDKQWLDKLQKVAVKQKGIDRTEDKYLESEDLKTLIKALDEQDRLITEFLALSGLRIGELIALEDSDIDDEGIHVTKDSYNGIVSDTPKTDSSNRIVSVQPELAAVISKIRRYRKIVMMSTGERSDTFMPFQQWTYSRHLADKAREVLGRNITPHMLRHTHASLLAEQGISLDAISRRLGHSDSKITRDIYTHVTEKRKEKENAEIAKIRIL